MLGMWLSRFNRWPRGLEDELRWGVIGWRVSYQL